MNYIKIVFLLCLLPFYVLAATSLKSDNYLSEKQKTVLTVAIGQAGYFPFNYKENGEIKGFSVELLDYIEANSKYDFEFIILPWPRALYLVSQGRVDVILTLFKTPKRDKTFHFIEPSYADEVNQLFTLIDNKFEFNGQLQQLTPYSIGTIREYSYGKAFDQASHLNKLPALTEAVLLKLLVSKRIDMLIANTLNFNQIIAQENMTSKVKAIKPYIETTPVYMAITRERTDAEEIKQTLGLLIAQFKASSNYQALLDKHQLSFK